MHLMTQDQYLDVLGGRGSRQEHEPREEHPYKHERDHAAVSGERFVPGPLKPFWSATPRPRTYLLVVDVSTWSADYRLTSSVIWSKLNEIPSIPGLDDLTRASDQRPRQCDDHVLPDAFRICGI